jgi:hypothetical protein
MSLHTNRRAFLAGLAVMALGVTLVARPAPARPAVQNALGTYTGTSVSVVDSEEADLVLVIDNQRNRRLSGTLSVTPVGGGDIVTVDLKGSVSASGNVSLLGRMDRARVLLKGKLVPADPAVPSPQMIEGRYKVARGTDKGTFSVALQ